MSLKTGDNAWYWTRRVGERAYRQWCTIRELSADGKYARVVIPDNGLAFLKPGYPRVRVVTADRLRPISEWKET